MKEITRLTPEDGGFNIYHVISEPGDATRYDYIVIAPLGGSDEYFFAPYGSTFIFPQRINKWVAKGIENVRDDNNLKMAKEYGCNPHTLIECIRTLMELSHDN